MLGLDKRTLAGLLFMALGMILIPIGDSIAKYISGVANYSPTFLAWSRFVIGVVVIVPLALIRTGFRELSFRFYVQQAIRGALIAATISLIITAVTLSPLADVFGAFFIGPALSVVFSVLLLKEAASKLEWCSVLLGFVGVLMVVQPDVLRGGGVSPGLIWALGAGVFYGGFLVATRWAAHSGPPLAQLATQLVFGFVFLAPFIASELLDISRQTDFKATAPLIVMGMTSALANYLSILALARARPAFLAPVIYLQIVAASVIGVFYFGDSINPLAQAGLALILLTGLLKVPMPVTKPHADNR